MNKKQLPADLSEKHTTIVNFIVKYYNVCLRTIEIDNV